MTGCDGRANRCVLLRAPHLSDSVQEGRACGPAGAPGARVDLSALLLCADTVTHTHTHRATCCLHGAPRSFWSHAPRKCVMFKVSGSSSRFRSATSSDEKIPAKSIPQTRLRRNKLCLLKDDSLCSAKSRRSKKRTAVFCQQSSATSCWARLPSYDADCRLL